MVENPYGGVVPELVDLLRPGRGHDLFRLSLYEGAAFGANMTVPYGAWMGSTIQDSFYAPHDLVVEVQTFLADHERLYSKALVARGGRRVQRGEHARADRPRRRQRQPRQRPRRVGRRCPTAS